MCVRVATSLTQTLDPDDDGEWQETGLLASHKCALTGTQALMPTHTHTLKHVDSIAYFIMQHTTFRQETLILIGETQGGGLFSTCG